MTERVVLVTGSTDGIGRAAARALAAAGAKVIIHGRSKAKVDAAVAAMSAELPGAQLQGVAFDLGTLAATRKGAQAVLELAPQLHVLVNNAGIIASERSVTADGLELTVAVDHVAPFLLTELLLPRLEASATSAPSRVINVASIAHTRGKAGTDFQLATNWSPYSAYAFAKLANVMHAMELAERHDAKKLVAYSLHPGTIGTKLLRQGFGPIQGGTVEQGARAIIRLAGSELVEEPSGTYFSEGTPTPPSTAARDAAARRALWDASMVAAKL
ncbi:MAG TPA: SDR family NAD(P)-dependent oxidoreductase [Kofleriaceae bacterium]|jgi:NAD(P)-dependent dehydrogenase (short-subunit alcohol dehydrogenase family)